MIGMLVSPNLRILGISIGVSNLCLPRIYIYIYIYIIEGTRTKISSAFNMVFVHLHVTMVVEERLHS